MWDKLSMKEKAAFIRTAVKNGIYDRADIVDRYNKFAMGGDTEETYDEPQTFAGDITKALGGSPQSVRNADVLSSTVQLTPYGVVPSLLDLGRDLNRAYHKEKGAVKDAALDVLSMLPFINKYKYGLKEAKNFLKDNRKLLNGIAVFGKSGDFVDDTYGANKTSGNYALGGHIYDGETEESQQMKKSSIAKRLYGFLSNTGGGTLFNGGTYTGSYHYGNEPAVSGNIIKTSTLYGGANADTTRNPLALYLGLDTIGLKKLRHDKYILDNDTTDVDVFEGKILPVKKDSSAYRLNPELKEEFDTLIEQNRTFPINTNNFTIRPDVYGNQTLDNVRHARVKPIKNKDGSYSMKVTKLWDLSKSLRGGEMIDWLNSKGGGKPFVLEQIVPVTFNGEWSPEDYDIRHARETVGKK